MNNKKKCIKKTELKNYKNKNKKIRKYKQLQITEKVKINNFGYSYKNKIILKHKKHKSEKEKKIFHNLINGISFILFSISYYFYYLSLEKCFNGEDIVKNWIGLN